MVRLMYHTKATVCCVFFDSNCKSKLRILRSASAHYPTLRSFLHAVYVARNSHLKILKLEQTLLNGDIGALIDASSVSFDNLFSITAALGNSSCIIMYFPVLYFSIQSKTSH